MIDRYQRLMPFILVLYILSIAVAFLYFNVRLSLEWVAIILFGAAILSGRALLFLRDWGVFIAVLFAWQLTSPLATHFTFPWHLTQLIDADRFLFFNHVPPQWMQEHLYHPGTLEPWDVFAASMYMLHFLAPLVSGFLIWFTNRDLFHRFAFTFVLVALAGFVTYILYPAVPPWMAAEPLRHVGAIYVADPHGTVHLPGVHDLFAKIAARWYNPNHGTIFFHGLHLSYDSVAAMPSEHAAYPMLFFLFLRRQFGRWGYLALLYIAGLLFSITYLGQHYVIDALVGFAYACIGYALVMHGLPAARAAWDARRQTAGARSPGSLRELEEV